MKIYEFAKQGIVLDGAVGTLRTQAGDEIELRPQSREVLKLLASQPHAIVSKDQFAKTVWGDRIVSDDSLVQCIAEIRAGLADNARTIIQTVPRKGYRFVPGDAVTQKAPRFGSRTIAVAAVLALFAVAVGLYVFAAREGGDARPSVVAVLPLDDLSAEPHRGYLSDALSEGIITELARFPQFQVVARNSSFQFRDAPKDLREIGTALGAGYVVEGSQQFNGDRIKVAVQLSDAASGVHLFADQYERDLDDLFEVQNEIVRQVASVVGQTLLSELPVRVAEKDVDSRLRGLQARNIMTQLSYENWQKAVAIEETSIREEPDSAWGYIGKSLMLGAAAALGWREPREDVLEEATELAETAMQLAPENYMSHYTLARVLSRRSAYSESILHFERAAALNPSDSIIWIGMSVPLLYTGQTEQALEVLERAAKVDPLHGDWLRWQQGLAHWQNNACDKGLSAMQSMSTPPKSSFRALAALYVCLGRDDDAKNALATYLESRPEHTIVKEKAAIPADWQPEGTATRWLDALQKAGLP